MRESLAFKMPPQPPVVGKVFRCVIAKKVFILAHNPNNPDLPFGGYIEGETKWRFWAETGESLDNPHFDLIEAIAEFNVQQGG